MNNLVLNTLHRFQRASFAVILATLISLAAVQNLSGQTAGTASVQGTVSDPTGASVPGAQVTLTNTETSTSRTTITDGSGLYSLPNVPVGPYKLTISAAGFRGFTESKVVLEVGNNLQINAPLTLGSTNETVEVQSSGVALETESSSFKQVIDQQRITELPLNGRQATQLILISGGAVNAPGNDLVGSKNYASSVAIAVAGSQGNYNNYVLDGGTNVDTFTNVNLPYPFPDALREFSVESNSLPARNGVHPGALVNVVTNSGTNQWHGTAFEFIRNNYLNANNFFSTTKDTLHRNQFGGTLGGKLISDKFFFFGGYQGTREKQATNAASSCLPTAAELTGDFSQQPLTGNCSQAKIGTGGKLIDPVTGNDITATRKLPTSSLSPQALALVKLLPTSQADPITGLVQIALPAINSEDQYVGRVDYSLNAKNSMFFTAFVTNYKSPAFYQPNNLLVTTTAGNDERVMHFTLGETFIISSKMVNTFHGTYARRRDNRGPAGGINGTNIGVNFFAYVPNDLRLSVTNGFNVGCGTCSPGFFNTNTEDFSDDVDYLRGKHQIAVGVEYIRTGDNTRSGYLQNGSFSFSGGLSGAKNNNVGESLIDFLTGQQNAFSQSRAQETTYRQNIFSVYAQDTWHATPRLTLSAGVRYEPYMVPVDKKGRGSSFSQSAFTANQHSTKYPNAPAGSFFYGDPGVSKSFANNSMLNFSPRVGVTYDPIGNGKTVFRFGGAIMYDSPGLFAIQRITSNPPFVNEIDQTGQISLANPYSNYAGGNPFPGVFPPDATAPFPAGSLYVIVPQNLHTPTVNQWTASMQQDLGKGWNFSLNYLGNKNTHLWVGTSFNPSVYIPGNSTGAAGSCGALTPVPAAGTACSSTKNTALRTRLVLQNPVQGAAYNYQMTLLDDGANSSYHGMIAAIQHRMSHNFSFLANYTWSHCISPADTNGDITAGVYEDPAHPRYDRANCGYDVRHIFNTTMVAESHFSSLPHFASAIFNNWELAPLVRILSGTPLNVTTGSDNSLNGVGLDRPNLNNSSLVYSHTKITQTAAGNRQYLSAKSAGAFTANSVGTIGNLGRNAFRQPNYYDVDAAVSRTFPIHERLALRIRLEAFNVMNHPNFNGFTTTLSSSTFGYATSAQAPRIFQAAAKFTF
jgi:hypothetical protein